MLRRLLIFCKDRDLKWARNGPPALLVDPVSATYARHWENTSEHKISLKGDHSTMIKFRENDRTEYPQIREVLERFTGRAFSVIKVRLGMELVKGKCS